MEEPTFARWIELPEEQPIRFRDLPGLIAGALHKSDFEKAAAEINLEAELKAMVEAGELKVRDPLTLEWHTVPVGDDALCRAVLTPYDNLRSLLASRGIGLRLIAYGTGPTYWTIENAAAAIAAQEGWHQGARDTLSGQMVQAAREGTLTVRHPHTGREYRPGEVTTHYVRVTPGEVNAWLALDPVTGLHWSIEANPAAAVNTQPEPPDSKRRLDALRALGGSAQFFKGKWRFTGIVKLAAQEKAQGRGRCDEKTVRADLKDAAEAEKQEGKGAAPSARWPP